MLAGCRSLHRNRRRHIRVDITVVSKCAGLREFEAKRPSRRNSPAIEGVAITRYCVWRGRVILPYDGGANCNCQGLRAEAKTAIVHNEHVHDRRRRRWRRRWTRARCWSGLRSRRRGSRCCPGRRWAGFCLCRSHRGLCRCWRRSDTGSTHGSSAGRCRRIRRRSAAASTTGQHNKESEQADAAQSQAAWQITRIHSTQHFFPSAVTGKMRRNFLVDSSIGQYGQMLHCPG
jgi:hypothetical protein